MGCVVIGINTEGKYVVVKAGDLEANILTLTLDELKDVDSIKFRDSLVSFNNHTAVSLRIVKSLLTSFEDNLVLLKKAVALEKLFECVTEVIVGVYTYSHTYSKHVLNIECYSEDWEERNLGYEEFVLKFSNKGNEDKWVSCADIELDEY